MVKMSEDKSKTTILLNLYSIYFDVFVCGLLNMFSVILQIFFNLEGSGVMWHNNYLIFSAYYIIL